MNKSKIAAALALAIASIVPAAANAAVITYYFSNTGIYNGTPLKDTSVFGTATFTDVTENIRGTKTSYVDLVMSVMPGLTVDAGAYVNDWAFNIGSGTSTKPTISGTAWVSGAKAGTVDIDGYKNFGGANGGNFDLVFNFQTSNPGQLAAGASSEYKLFGTNLSAGSFTFVDSDIFNAAVHVQGMASPSSFFSGTTTKPVDGSGPGTGGEVPEPATVALLGLGLFGFAIARRKAKSKNA